MRMPRNFSTVTTTTAITLSLCLAACQGSVDGPNDQNSPGGDGDGTGGTGAGEGDGDISDPKVCIPGIPGSTQIPRLLNREYDAVIAELLKVDALASGAKPSSVLVPDYQGSMTDIAWNSYLVSAQDLASQVMSGPNRAEFIACDPAQPTCLSDTIRAFGRKAFRRPLTDIEVARFEKLGALAVAGTPDEVAEATLFAFLSSPSFLLIPELSPELEGNAIKLSQYEVAARLSFLLWGSTPDPILSAAADAGELATKEQLLAQAERMVQDRGKTSPIVIAFHRSYAQMVDGSRWGTKDHDPALYPTYSQTMEEPLMQEMDMFFEAVAYDSGTFQDLFLSNKGFVNQDTAVVYGLDASAYGPELVPVEFPAGERPGFLTRGAFLSSYSNYSSTSPILRGAFITERILGIEISSPPPGATDKPVPPGEYATNREIIEALTTPLPCGNCHNPFINPPGFALERYNAFGVLQDTDRLGGPIDSTADVYFTEEGPTPVSSPVDLMSGIATTAEARRRYAEAWVSFATKRDPNSQDACIVDGLSTKLGNDGYSILNLLTELTQADAFTRRTVKN
jgi:Protein of unknown function (DUF1592)/Protein of unknown function (DUF1588)/Protein of unknown function (DUF1585)/Protein of unknown function (DUF1595)